MAGPYIVTIKATDPKVTGLTYSITKALNVANVAAEQLVYGAGGIPQTANISFSTLSATGSLASVSCPTLLNLTTGKTLDNSSSQYVTCTATTPIPIASATTSVAVAIALTPAGSTSSIAPNSRSGGVYAAMAFGVPVLAFFGWFGRNKARKNIFRMMAILMLAFGALSTSGCGGGYKAVQLGSTNPGTALDAGSYKSWWRPGIASHRRRTRTTPSCPFP